MLISEETINEVREKSSIVQVIGETVQLQRKGTSYMGLCPFHGEKSPSFSVREEGYYHCFGCGESGNVFSFLMKQRGLSFPETVQELAERCGVTVQYTGDATREKRSDNLKDRKKIEEVLRIAVKFYRYALQNAPEHVKQYVQRRSITDAASEEFLLGYAPAEWRCLTDVLRKKGFSDEELFQSGVARRNSKGELYDTFRGRIVFPVAVAPNRFAGFGGRILPGQDENNAPKYINSPESPVYHKSKILYGVPHATTAIREKQMVYLVEGYMDVLSLWQSGVQNVLATCGTAVASGHIERMKHLCSRVRVLFDGDAAGRKAAGRLFPLFVGSGIDVEVIFLDAGEDPDTLAQAHGSQLDARLNEMKRISLLDCYIDYLLSSSGISDVATLGPALKGKLCQKVIEVLEPIKNPIEKDELFQQAARHLDVDSTAFKDAAEGTQRSPLSGGDASSDPFEYSEVTSVAELPALDRTLLQVSMVHRDSIPQEVLSSPQWCQILHPATLSFVSLLSEIVLSELSEGEKKSEIQELLKRSGPHWIAHWKSAYQIHQDSPQALLQAYDECRGRLKSELLRRELDRIELDLKATDEDEEKLKLSQRRLELAREIKLTA